MAYTNEHFDLIWFDTEIVCQFFGWGLAVTGLKTFVFWFCFSVYLFSSPGSTFCTLISVFVPSQCYRSSMQKILVILPKVQVTANSPVHYCALLNCESFINLDMFLCFFVLYVWYLRFPLNFFFFKEDLMWLDLTYVASNQAVNWYTLYDGAQRRKQFHVVPAM